MGLVYRNGRPYLYKSVRRAGRVTSEYDGSGEIALLIAQMRDIDRDEREMERYQDQAERDAIDADECILNSYFDRVEDLARAALYSAGFHRPKREWRRRRVRRQEP
jgi:hypothetical protein